MANKLVATFFCRHLNDPTRPAVEQTPLFEISYLFYFGVHVICAYTEYYSSTCVHASKGIGTHTYTAAWKNHILESKIRLVRRWKYMYLLGSFSAWKKIILESNIRSVRNSK